MNILEVIGNTYLLAIAVLIVLCLLPGPHMTAQVAQYLSLVEGGIRQRLGTESHHHFWLTTVSDDQVVYHLEDDAGRATHVTYMASPGPVFWWLSPPYVDAAYTATRVEAVAAWLVDRLRHEQTRKPRSWWKRVFS